MFDITDIAVSIIAILVMVTAVELVNRDNPCHVRANHPSECSSDNIQRGK